MVAVLSCAGESPTVIPEAAKQGYAGGAPGTPSPQLTGSYPESGDTGIPIDAKIILVFSKPINLATVIPANVTITGVTAFTATAPGDPRTVVITITTPATLSYSTGYTITLGTGIQDTDGKTLDTTYSWSFTTAASTASEALPRVIAATRYPANGATNISIANSFVEVAFTRDMTPGTITTGSFGIAPAVGASITQITNQIYRLNLTTPLAYSQSYTVTLTSAIQDTSTNSLDLDGNHTWSFTTEADPVPAGTTVDSVWIDAVYDTYAVVKFTTSKPVAQNRCYALYNTTPPILVSAPKTQESAATTLSTTHTVTIPAATLSPSTLYYARAGIDTTAIADGNVEVLSGSDIDFYTRTNATVNTSLSNAANDQTALTSVQIDDGSSYVFWVDNGTAIKGQRFNTAGAIQWAAAGLTINTTANTSGPVAINNRFADAVVVYKDSSNNLYAQRCDNAGKAGAEITVASSIRAGSKYSACLVHERPAVISSGTTDMPNNGTATNLLYDRDQNFSTLPFLDVNDVYAVDNAGINWTNGTISNQTASPYDIFPYVLITTVATNLAAISNYYVLDADTVITGTADSSSTTTQIRCSTTNLSTVNSGDIIRTSDGTWGLASANGAWNIAGYWYVDVDRTLTGFADGDTFTIYTQHAGPLTSEAVTNPLWDTAPATLFNPGTTVLAGDYVVNMAVSPTVSATVSAIDLTRDTNYALRLSNDIMDNAQNYYILRLPTSAAYRAVGYATGVATDFNLTDSNSPFGAVSAGDVVYNINADLSATVTAAAANSLTLSADIFNTVGHRAFVYSKRAFLVAFVDNNDYIDARSFNLADGAPVSAAFAVCTNLTGGANSNPVAVTDDAGNAIIFYERNGTIYVKKVSATGSFLWAGAASTAAGTGLTALAGYTIIQALPDHATGGVGGAYLLAETTAGGTIAVVRIDGSTGTPTSFGTFAGTEPHMIVDSSSGPNRVIIAYRRSSGGYYHIRMTAYNISGTNVIADTNVTTVGLSYHCMQPRVALADTAAADSGYYITWFDGRYINYYGYSIYSRQFNSAGAAIGGELFVSSPTASGYDYALLLATVYYAGGILPFWLDYRAYGTTGIDIYYDTVP